MIIQMMEHAQLGTIAFTFRPDLWADHHQIAVDAFNTYTDLLVKLVSFPVGNAATRHVFDAEYLGELYRSGSSVAIHLCLAVQHFCLVIERATGTAPPGPLRDRVKAATQAAGLKELGSGSGYDALVELQRIRDAIEHPKVDNTFRGGHDGSWDSIPAAWLLSERADSTFRTTFDWFDRLHDRWQEWVKAQPPQTLTFEVQRGMKSLRQFKKPPA